MKIDTRWFTIILTFAIVASVACSRRTDAADIEVVQAPIFSSANPQYIYAADPNDSWNRIFRALFTRTVKARLASDFGEGAPFVSFHVRMGSFDLRISKNTVSRTEIGDRAIEPLYPTFFTVDGPLQVLSEPRVSELTTALREAIEESKQRSSVERALMQSDVWAAYDIIYETGRGNEEAETFGKRKAVLLSLLTKFVRKLALTSDQINALNNNYLRAVTGRRLPNVFSMDNGWLEIELLADRSHDHSAGYRRAARVFVKPRLKSADPGEFVEKLKHNQHLEEVEAVALIVQNLLIDSSGRVVPSPVFSNVQFRFFSNDIRTGQIDTEVREYELSRRLLLTDPATGGFAVINQTEPAYLIQSGNDFGFATSINDANAPVVVPLRTKCRQCHGTSLKILMTYSIHYFPPVPTVRILKPADNERALYVSRLKQEREDFKSLFGVR